MNFTFVRKSLSQTFAAYIHGFWVSKLRVDSNTLSSFTIKKHYHPRSTINLRLPHWVWEHELEFHFLVIEIPFQALQVLLLLVLFLWDSIEGHKTVVFKCLEDRTLAFPFFNLSILLSTCSKSDRANSKLIVATSSTGFTRPSTCITYDKIIIFVISAVSDKIKTSSSSKHRTVWIIASHSRIFERNLFPSPWPSEAPYSTF